jgi:hypothetical protein
MGAVREGSEINAKTTMCMKNRFNILIQEYLIHRHTHLNLLYPPRTPMQGLLAIAKSPSTAPGHAAIMQTFQKLWTQELG